jgi:capsular exopolysaccharide synthesis family protein
MTENRPPDISSVQELDPDNALDPGLEASFLNEIWHMYRRRWHAFAAALVVCVLAGLYLLARAPKQYDATAIIGLSSEDKSVRLGEAPSYNPFDDFDSDTRIENQISILTSRTLMLRVAKALDLYHDRNFSVPGKGETPNGPENPVSMYRMLGVMSGTLEVSKVQRTTNIAIRARTRSPELSARIANSLVNEYINRSYQTRYESQQGVSSWLAKQLEDLRKQTEAAQQKTIALQKKIGVLNLVQDPTAAKNGDASQTLAGRRIEALETDLTKAQSDRLVLEAQYQTLTQENSNSLPETTAGSVLSELRHKLNQTTLEIDELSARYGPRYQRLKDLRALQKQIEKQLDVEAGSSLGRARAGLEAARASEASLRNALENERREAEKRSDDIVQYTIARREFESSYELYEGLLSKLKEAGVLASLRSSNVDVIDPALIPLAPRAPRKTRYRWAGLGAGVVLGSLLVFLIDATDKSVLNGDMLERLTGVPTIGYIPLTKGRSLVDLAPGSLSPQRQSNEARQAAEAYRSLRTSLLLARAGHPPRVILVTSSIPAEGKSTTCANLAAMLARDNASVLLVDADLRRPALHRLMNTAQQPGLCNFLAGQKPLEECIFRTDSLPTLSFMPCGPKPPNPVELLSSRSFEEGLATMRARYDFILFDSAPTLSVSDALVLAARADGVLFIVKAGSTSRTMVARALRTLRRSGAHVLGTVLNSVDYRSGEYGYHGYYDYYVSGESDETEDRDA